MWNYENLEVYHKAHNLIIVVYGLTEEFPKSEIYGLTSQVRRAIISISANIFEGYRKRTNNEFISYLNNSIGLRMA